MLFHQNNAPPHKANETLMVIDYNVGFERIEHSPYSPDLAPMDFAVFPRMKGELRGKRFDNVYEIQTEVRSFLKKCTEDWYSEIYSAWIERHRKCIACDGEYFEKM